MDTTTTTLAIEAFNAITAEAYYGFNLKLVLAKNPQVARAVIRLANRAKREREATNRAVVLDGFNPRPSE